MPDADRVEVIFPASASDRIRTCNLLLTKQLLCHLSYRSIFGRSNSPEKMGKLPTTNYLQFAYFVNTKVPHTVSRTENVVHKHNI